jgi:hypothetical protein
MPRKGHAHVEGHGRLGGGHACLGRGTHAWGGAYPWEGGHAHLGGARTFGGGAHA